MKVIKDENQSLLLNCFGLADRYYLAVNVLTFFHFDHPQEPLMETEMWPFVQNELGSTAILDAAMPKPRAEVLIRAKCFAPHERPVQATKVSVRIGRIEKDLLVFGSRHWQKKAGVVWVATDPEPFTSMDINYTKAFGGQGFAQNPTGLGFTPVLTKDGHGIVQLPNVEDPRQLVSGYDDFPAPAGFGPYDLTWPQRARKLGTYDQKWLRDRWPYFPDDMDWTFFNAAPDDQQMDGYFQGDETLALRNMHPTKPLLESRLPGIKHRCFVFLKPYTKDPAATVTVKEVKLRLNTVWLFPHMERGISIYRGAVEVTDDEGLDVRQLCLAAESLDELPKTRDYYLEEFQKRLERKTQVDQTMLDQARKKLAEAKELLRELPEKIKESLAQGLGQAPAPSRTPEEIISGGLALVESQARLLDDGEKALTRLKSQYGHLAKIDLSRFKEARANLAEVKAGLQAIPASLDQARSKMESARAQTKESLKAAIDKARQYGPLKAKLEEMDLEALLDPLKPSAQKLWRDAGMRFVEQCRDNLFQDHQTLRALHELGLSSKTVRRAWLGINPEEQRLDPVRWGLAGEDEEEEAEPLIIGPGLVIPCFKGADLIGIIVRPGDPVDKAQDEPVKGSQSGVLTLGVAPEMPVVRVREQLEALLLFQETGGSCAVAAISDPGAPIDQETSETMAQAPQFLVTLYPETARPKEQTIEQWQETYLKARPLPLPAGRNLFEARESGTNLRKWALEGLGPDWAAEAEEPLPPEEDDGPGAVVLPMIDVGALIQSVKDTVMAQVQPEIDRLEAMKNEGMEQAREQLIQQGQDPDEHLTPPAAALLDESDPTTAARKKLEEQLAATRNTLEKQNLLTPEIESKLAEVEKSQVDLLDKSAQRYKEGRARLEAAKAKIEAGQPEWARKLMIKGGLDPDDPEPLKTLTREEVVQRYQDGLSLAGKNLAGLDLSNLNLAGADLKKAILEKTDFSETDLSGADLREALANEADFSKAVLKKTSLAKGLFQKAKFSGADLEGGDLTSALLSEADLTGARLVGTRLEKAVMEKTKLNKVRMSRAEARQGNFLEADLSAADLTGADLTKAVFLNASVDEADFSQSMARSAFFLNASGKKVKFTAADLHNARIINGAVLPEADFTNTQADRACWMKSDLSGGDFRGSRIGRGMIEECDLTGADFTGVSARETRFNKSDLSSAKMRGLNLFFGSLRKAKLVDTDLSGANLYGAEFYRTKVGQTRLTDANLKMTKLEKYVDTITNKTKPE